MKISCETVRYITIMYAVKKVKNWLNNIYRNVKNVKKH